MLLEMEAFNFDNSYNSFPWPEYLIDFYVKNGSHVRLSYSCVGELYDIWIPKIRQCIDMGTTVELTGLPYFLYGLFQRNKTRE